MEFLNPAAFSLLFLLPLLIIPYLIKKEPRRVIFSSLLFLPGSPPASRPWGRLYLPPLFFLQLLLLLLLILALAEPVFSVRLLKVAIVLDNSASMQALEGGKSRFEIARDKAAEIIGSLSARGRVDLYTTAPRLERSAAGLEPGEALKLLGRLTPYDLGESQVDYGTGLSRLAKENSYERLFFLTDHEVRGQGQVIRAVLVGRPKDNLAVTSFRLVRPSFGSSQLAARVEVTSFSSRAEKVRLSLKGDGKVLSSRTLTVAPLRSVSASIDGLPFHEAYEAELEARDGLSLDNRRFAVAPPAIGLEILGISPRPEALSSLRSIPGVRLRVISPEDYEKDRGARHSLEIFHFSFPALLPEKPALFVLPPKKNPLAAAGDALTGPQISAWREPHPLTRYVNFALFRLSYARSLKPLSPGDKIIESPQGPLAVAWENEGPRYLVLGFDPFPYLGRENLPVSIFTLNFLGWFQEGTDGSGAATGKPLNLGSARAEGTAVVTPRGERFPVRPGARLFPRTYFQGLYQIVRGEEKGIVAVNFQDIKESDLHNSVAINLPGQERGSASPSLFFSLWPYLLLASLLLLILEWFWNAPIARTVQRDYRRAESGL